MDSIDTRLQSKTHRILIGFVGLCVLSVLIPFVLMRVQDFYQADTIRALTSYDPQTAYDVLTQLEVFEPVAESYFQPKGQGQSMYDTPWLGLTNDDEYCQNHLATFVEDPEAMISGPMKFITAFKLDSSVRTKVLSSIGEDVQPEVGLHATSRIRDSFTYDLRPDAQIFFSKYSPAPYKEIGRHIGCLGQAVSHIPGDFTLNRKDMVAESATEYAKNYTTRPQCVNNEKFFPETWTLYEEEPCRAFFEIINGAEYARQKAEKTVVYIRKVGDGPGTHGGLGVAPVTEKEEAALRMKYENGALCGSVIDNIIVQYYVDDPLLINGRKFDFRTYMLVASTNPLMTYYHDGILRVSEVRYDTNSSDDKVYMNNLDPEQWLMSDLIEYLLESKTVTDPEWLDNYLRPEFKRAMIHLVRMSQHSFLQRSSVYALYGVDFMLDKDMNLWFIEANAGRSFAGHSQRIKDFIYQMLKDHFEIVHGLVRSRMRRVADYVSQLIADGSVVVEDNMIAIQGLDKKRAEFKAITRNYFEKEFEPSTGNGFSKIIDEHYDGAERYQGLIAEECL